MNRRLGFTLIELLIVVAIIAILAAIAVPNFIEAQTRAKVSRVHSELRTLATAVESYYADWSSYPLHGAILQTGENVFPAGNPSDVVNRHLFAGHPLTTPTAYLTVQPFDPFVKGNLDHDEHLYFYTNLDQAAEWLREAAGSVPSLVQTRIKEFGPWMMHSAGPDGDRLDTGSSAGSNIYLGIYDPTNGTLSNGDILRVQKLGIVGR